MQIKTMENSLTHLTNSGEVHMVDVGERAVSRREALAEGALRMKLSTLDAVLRGETSKGDLLAVARVAAIQAAKRTWELIPLCHPLSISSIEVAITQDQVLPGLRLQASCHTIGQTGVEMEAMTAVSVGLLTIYDMLKAIEPSMVIDGIRLMSKEGGQSGTWSRMEPKP
ncbi:cyclic pyranopterin monophosphate synthase MoaC [cyanobiont of Ornithocercus magnificus]|nr:cyclic pyranopterin monophosphate synthase MoaC [cyanobiont of Ornithocercus magnificus]